MFFPKRLLSSFEKGPESPLAKTRLIILSVWFLGVAVFSFFSFFIEAGELGRTCQAEIILAIGTQEKNPSFFLKDPEELENLFESLRNSFALPFIGNEDDVVNPETPEIYQLQLSFSGCKKKCPKTVVFWKGLIVISSRLKGGKLIKEVYLADTQGIERRLIEMGWKQGAFSGKHIKAIPTFLRPEGWKDPGN